ncbi:MAG: nucleotidyl transferase AbiEii/AbiGii toxin family protein [Candidatus Glassbacteria bacterium]|nr:nucleotidyl transferase AbiEii/AbiGii toxin family protein [Candidatus Glassbacteria bacterium]
MLSLEQILEQYPASLRNFPESLLKEYLQYKILDSIFNSASGQKLAFLGGTALRIIHNGSRFSEDLDFDNFDLKADEFVDLGDEIKKYLELEGLEVEIDSKTESAYRLKIRIPRLLFDTGLAHQPEQKILIQVDTVPQNFDYRPDKPILNKFEVFTQINAVPRDILLAQKIFAAVGRKRAKGRDFFDIVFLYGIGARPNFDYLEKNLDIKEQKQLKISLLEKTKNMDFKSLAQDVEPFLFNPKDSNKVFLFREFIRQQF